MTNKYTIKPNFYCSWFTTWNYNETIKDTCPYKVEGRKQCIKNGKVCRNLVMELVDSQE